MRLERHEVRNGDDQTVGNTDELYKIFTEVNQQDELRGNNGAVHGPLCVTGQILKDCRTCILKLCWDQWHWIHFSVFMCRAGVTTNTTTKSL